MKCKQTNKSSFSSLPRAKLIYYTIFHLTSIFILFTCLCLNLPGGFFPPNSAYTSQVTHACYMSSTFHLPLYAYPNNILEQCNHKAFHYAISRASCYFILVPKYSPQHRSQTSSIYGYVLPSIWETTFHTTRNICAFSSHTYQYQQRPRSTKICSWYTSWISWGCTARLFVNRARNRSHVGNTVVCYQQWIYTDAVTLAQSNIS